MFSVSLRSFTNLLVWPGFIILNIYPVLHVFQSFLTGVGFKNKHADEITSKKTVLSEDWGWYMDVKHTSIFVCLCHLDSREDLNDMNSSKSNSSVRAEEAAWSKPRRSGQVCGCFVCLGSLLIFTLSVVSYSSLNSLWICTIWLKCWMRSEKDNRKELYPFLLLLRQFSPAAHG